VSTVPLSETAFPILAILIGDFWNKICHFRTHALQRKYLSALGKPPEDGGEAS
jgi:hypothetical protein